MNHSVSYYRIRTAVRAVFLLASASAFILGAWGFILLAWAVAG